MTSETIKKTIRDFFGETTKIPTEIMLTKSLTALTRFSSNSITQNVNEESIDITLRVIENGKTMRITSNQFTPDGLKKIYDKAVDLNQYSHPDDNLQPLLESSDDISFDSSYRDETAALTPQDRAKLVSICVERAEEHSLQTAGIISDSIDKFIISNNKGLWREYDTTRFRASISVMSDTGSGWAAVNSYDYGNVSVEEVAAKAVDKALINQNQIDLEPGLYTVVLEPAAVADLMAFLNWTGFNGLAYLEKRSFMSENIGKKIMSDKLTIIDDVGHPLVLGMPFDFEGVETKKIKLIENGVARAVAYDRRTAIQAKAESTGHSLPQPNSFGPIPRALVMMPGESSLEDMIKNTDKGILVTRFHYTNLLDPMKVNVTGMTRDGLFQIENGCVSKAIKNFRFTESVLKAFNNIIEIGKKQELVGGFFGGGFVVPALKIENFHFSSKTEF